MLRHCRNAAAVVLLALGVSNWAGAQSPAVTRLTPLGVQPDETVDLVVQGSNLEGAGELWTSCAGFCALTGGVENNGTEGGTCTFRLTVPQQAPLGLHGVRVATPHGVSALRLILVDDLPTVIEQAGNQKIETAQAIEVPCAVDGSVDDLTRDYFRFRAQKGQTVSFEVWGRRLGSPLDPVLFLYRADGRELNFSDDAEGLSGDPQLVHTFDETGEYLLELRDIQYRGGDQYVYRLRIGDFPCVNVPVPAAVTKGVSTRIDFAGVSVDDATPDFVEIPAGDAAYWWPVRTRRSQGTYHAFSSVKVHEAEEFLEREPNDTREQANRVAWGASLNGRFDRPGDIDRYVLSAQKGEKLDLAGITRQIGSPTDLTLKVLKPDGGQLAAVDDSGTNEGSMTVTFPDAGDYIIEAIDLHRRGGSQYAYRIQVTPRTAGFQLTASAEAITVPAGGVTPVSVNVARSGYGGEIALHVENLPAGFVSTPTTIGQGMNSGVLTIEADLDAPSGKMAPVQIVGTGRSGDQVIVARADVTEVLRTGWNGTTLVPIAFQHAAAVAAGPRGKLRMWIEPREASVSVDRKVQLTVKAERGEGIEEAITLATDPDKNALPKGASLDVKPVAKGTSEIVLELSVSKETPAGTYSIVLSGVHKKGKETVTVWTPALTYQVTK